MLFTGFQFNTPNTFVSINFLGLIPMVIIFLMNIISGFFWAPEIEPQQTYKTNHGSRSKGTSSGSYRQSKHSTQPEQGYETNYLLYGFLSIGLTLFFMLPAIIRRLNRNTVRTN